MNLDYLSNPQPQGLLALVQLMPWGEDYMLQTASGDIDPAMGHLMPGLSSLPLNDLAIFLQDFFSYKTCLC